MVPVPTGQVVDAAVLIFREGDVVQLASGGPKMTVVSAVEGQPMQCMWFLDDGVVQQAGFRPAWLRKAEGKK